VKLRSSKLHPIAKNRKVVLNLSSVLMALLILVLLSSMRLQQMEKTLKHSSVIHKQFFESSLLEIQSSAINNICEKVSLFANTPLPTHFPFFT
jgi:CHASE3 domain sensor protein